MVFPAPDMDARRSEAKASITLDQVVEFLQAAPQEFIDYILSILAGEESSTPTDPQAAAALDAVTPVPNAPVR